MLLLKKKTEQLMFMKVPNFSSSDSWDHPSSHGRAISSSTLPIFVLMQLWPSLELHLNVNLVAGRKILVFFCYHSLWKQCWRKPFLLGCFSVKLFRPCWLISHRSQTATADLSEYVSSSWFAPSYCSIQMIHNHLYMYAHVVIHTVSLWSKKVLLLLLSRWRNETQKS